MARLTNQPLLTFCPRMKLDGCMHVHCNRDTRSHQRRGVRYPSRERKVSSEPLKGR
jgi:hypothetical protein